jgi:hypothetical protein
VVTIDFNRAIQDAKSASFEALPAGDYDVEVAEATGTRSSNGKPMIKTLMKVLSGGYTGRQVWNNFVLSMENPQAMAIFFRHMKCFKLDENFFASLGANGSMDAVATALVGRRARLTLGIREWNGENRNEVKQIKPFTGAPASAGPTPTAGPVGPSGPGAASYGPGPAGPAPLPPAPMMPTGPAAAPQGYPAPLAAAPVPPPQPAQPAVQATYPTPPAEAISATFETPQQYGVPAPAPGSQEVPGLGTTETQANVAPSFDPSSPQPPAATTSESNSSPVPAGAPELPI